MDMQEKQTEVQTETEKRNRNSGREQLPVGVFDSGVGGISVLRELVKILPQEDFYYFGDSANAPYGTKTREQIRDLTCGHAEKMRKKGIKALVVACNTATSAAIGDLRSRYPDFPVIGIEPALKPAVMMAEHPSVLVLATPGTVAGEKFQNLMRGFEDQAQMTALACPGLMEFVENGQIDSPQLRSYLQELFLPFREKKPDVVVLGCTHYPFLRNAIRAQMGEEIPILDGSAGTARETKRRLAGAGLLRSAGHHGQVIFEMSLPGKETLCRKLLAL